MFEYVVVHQRETDALDHSVNSYAKEGYRVINFNVNQDKDGVFYVALMELEKCPNCCSR